MKPWVSPMPPEPKKLVVNEIVEEKLSSLVEKMEDLLKPFQHKLKIGIEKDNCKANKVRIEIEFKV